MVQRRYGIKSGMPRAFQGDQRIYKDLLNNELMGHRDAIVVVIRDASALLRVPIRKNLRKSAVGSRLYRVKLLPKNAPAFTHAVNGLNLMSSVATTNLSPFHYSSLMSLFGQWNSVFFVSRSSLCQHKICSSATCSAGVAFTRDTIPSLMEAPPQYL